MKRVKGLNTLNGTADNCWLYKEKVLSYKSAVPLVPWEFPWANFLLKEKKTDKNV